MSYKLKKHDEIKNEKTGEIATVEGISWRYAKLSNGDRVKQEPYSYMGTDYYAEYSSLVKYTIHKQANNPVKVKKQHFGLFGQPIVVDLDKEVL